MADHFGCESTAFSISLKDEIVWWMMEQDGVADEDFGDSSPAYNEEFFEKLGTNLFRINYHADTDNLISYCTPEEAVHSGRFELKNFECDIGNGQKAYGELRHHFNGGDSDIGDFISYSIFQRGKLVSEIVMIPENKTSKARDRFFERPTLDEVLAHWQNKKRFPELPGSCTKLFLNGVKQEP